MIEQLINAYNSDPCSGLWPFTFFPSKPLRNIAATHTVHRNLHVKRLHIQHEQAIVTIVVFRQTDEIVYYSENEAK